MPNILFNKNRSFVPLSFAQQRLWFLDKVLPRKNLYNIPFVLKLKGALNVDAFDQAFNALIQRHEILRTFLTVTQGQVCQIILPELKINIKENILNLMVFSSGLKEAKFDSIIQKEFENSFDLTSCPLFRCKLIKLESDYCVIVLTLHHIITDEWSMKVLYRDLVELYNSSVSGANANLPPLTFQYADFSIWQREIFIPHNIELQSNYWGQKLKDVREELVLPFAKSRPKSPSYEGEVYCHIISKFLYQKLEELAKQENCSLFMVLLSAFQILIFRYTGENDIILGCPIANRHYQGVENLIGFFVNLLPFRSQLEDSEDFKSLLFKTKELTLEVYENQDIPFDKLVDLLKLKGSLDKNPLFQIVFKFDDSDYKNDTMWEGLTQVEQIEIFPTASKFDLSLAIIEKENNLRLRFEYAKDVYRYEDVQRLAQHYENLLQNIIENPRMSIGAIKFLTEEERVGLLTQWNQTEEKFAGPDNFVLAFEEQVEKTPQACAAIYKNESITYTELNKKSNKISHHLLKLNKSHEQLIPIMMDRNMDFLVSMIGIFKTGAAFIPIDPALPKERIKVIFEESQAKELLVSEEWKDLAYQFVTNNIAIHIYEELLEKETNEENPNLPIYPNTLAYVIYTSGSTGKPKGAMVEQGGMINHLRSKIKDFKISEVTRLAQTATISVDVSIWQYISALLKGGTTVIFPSDSAWDPVQLLMLMETERVTLFQTVPSHMEVILEELETNLNKKKSLQTLQYIIVNGEALHASICHRWHRIYPTIPLTNAYGATECSDDSTHYFIYGAPHIEQGIIPINGALPNMKVYVLDNNLEPAPISVTGEIFFGGLGVGRGYLNDPVKTAKAFIPNPFQTEEEIKVGTNSRIYKTGDLGRWLSDGTLEYINRADFQVKIRGNRIELGEIEAHILKNSTVRQTVVSVWENPSSTQKKLVAYIVLDRNTLPNQHKEIIAKLRESLSVLLPDYMVPHLFIILESLPLNHNGKVDRKSLPDPTEVFTSFEKSVILPRNDIEKALYEIWVAVLGNENISIHDNFFEVGGDSIISIQIASKARQRGINFAIKDVFQHPTIADIAKVVVINNSNVSANKIELKKLLIGESFWSSQQGGRSSEVKVFTPPISHSGG